MTKNATTGDVEPLGSPRDRRRAVVVVVAILVMVGMPLSRLGEGTSNRFGWQMFSAGKAATEFAIVSDSGETVDVNPADYIHILRSALPIEELLPPHLCTVEPAATSIIVRAGGFEETVQC